MTEFALIAPILFLFIFVMLDFGRGTYYYVTIQQAVHEGARVALRWSYPLPADATVEQAVQQHAIAPFLANPCRPGPLYLPGRVPQPHEGSTIIPHPPPPS